jgi:hypothetical protein
MKRKAWTLSIAVAVILITVSFPTINSQSIDKVNTDPITKEIKLCEKVELRIFHIKGNGGFTKTIKEIPVDDHKEMMKKLAEIKDLNLTLREQFEEKLQILKEYEIVSNETTLNEILGVERLEDNGSDIFPFKVVVNENFQAHFAPIFIVGIGFGFGLGLEIRLANGFLHFLAIVGGLGLIICCDIIEGIIYVLWTFTFPIFIGYMAGYAGLIMFAVYPGYVYSNFVALGLVPYTFWFQLFSVKNFRDKNDALVENF